jgi:tRNA pseudouridine55 synthase
LVIDKSTGFTSMDVCAIVRGKLRKGGAPKRVKVGHGGTLDPAATGVLVVLVGRATKLCDTVMAGEKEYLAEVDLARTSTTDDAEGTITTVEVGTPPTRGRVEEACRGFVGVIQQTPPDFSAIHVGGRRAYDMAREGKVLKLAARAVTVAEVRVVEYQWPRLSLDIRCGKGVYIRSIARDLGRTLGTGGMLTALRRTRVGRFTIDMGRQLGALAPILTQSDLRPLEGDAAESRGA